MTDDNAEDDGLKSLRAMWLSMPDEDPPDRGFAELMAAARVKADEMAAAKPSLWQRLVEQLRRPPVLALATVMVLCGGAVLIGQRGDRMEAEPPAATQPVIATGATEMAPQAPPAAEPAAAAPSMDEDKPSEPAVTERAVSKPPPAKQAPRGRTRASSGEGLRAESSTAVLDDAVAAPEKADTSRTTTAKGSESFGTTAGASVPMTPPPTAAQLHERARGAAARGDCEAARTLVRRIEKQDAAYYAAKVARDGALATCLER